MTAQPELPFPDPKAVLSWIAVCADGRRVVVRPSAKDGLWDVCLQAGDGTVFSRVGPFSEEIALQRARWLVDTEAQGLAFSRVWVMPETPWVPQRKARQTRQDAPGSTKGPEATHHAWPEPDVDYSAP